MKKLIAVALAFVLLVCFAACSDNGEETTTIATTTTTQNTTVAPDKITQEAEDLEKFSEDMAEEGYLCGVAYLGYYSESIGVIVEDLDYKKIYDEYTFLRGIKRSDFYSLEGSEVYAVVPAEDVEITVNEYAFDENANGSVVRELAHIDDGRAVLLRGNISDIMPSFQLVITDEDGKSTEYFPQMSLNDGYLCRAQQIYDFSPYKLIGENFEGKEPIYQQVDFDGVWLGECYDQQGNAMSLILKLKGNGEADYQYGYNFGEIIEAFEGSWYDADEGKINLIMYGGPEYSDEDEADESNHYEFDGTFEVIVDEDDDKLCLRHISGMPFIYGTDGQDFNFLESDED